MTKSDLQASSNQRPRFDLLYFDAGGGHRSSAMAVKEIAEQQHRAWKIHLINLRDLLEPADVIRRFTGVRIEDLYNALLKSGITIGSGPMLRLTQMLIRRCHSTLVELLARHWQRLAPGLVVSMIPNFNRAIFEALRQADARELRAETPMVTILTDLADCPPHFWIECQRQYLVCGTSTAAEQAIAMGHAPEYVFRTSGMIVRPEFYRATPLDREIERRRLELDPELATGIVVFGSFGSRRMADIAWTVAKTGLKTQLIFICGHNDKLRRSIARMSLPFPFLSVGFTQEIPYFMRLADFFIGKPGPGSISEALVMGLPVIVERNAWTMVQERFNTDWIAQNRLGIVLSSRREIGSALAEMLNRERLERFRANVKTLANRAVFEIPDILEALIRQAGSSEPAMRQSPAQHATKTPREGRWPFSLALDTRAL